MKMVIEKVSEEKA